MHRLEHNLMKNMSIYCILAVFWSMEDHSRGNNSGTSGITFIIGGSDARRMGKHTELNSTKVFDYFAPAPSYEHILIIFPNFTGEQNGRTIYFITIQYYLTITLEQFTDT